MRVWKREGNVTRTWQNKQANLFLKEKTNKQTNLNSVFTNPKIGQGGSNGLVNKLLGEWEIRIAK